MSVAHAVVVERLDAISRSRPLTDDEVRQLHIALVRMGVKRRQPWTRYQDRKLRDYLERGKKPRQIAALLGRTERAVWRRMCKLGLAVGLACPEHVFTPSRLRRACVQSRRPPKRGR